MQKHQVTFNQEQLEYLQFKYKTILSSTIYPSMDSNTIMYNAGVSLVINDIASKTHIFRGTPPRG